MDHTSFDRLTRTVATRRRGLAALIGAIAVGLAAPTTEAKRKKSRCKHVTCRGECCKHGESCTLIGCASTQGWGECPEPNNWCGSTCCTPEHCGYYGGGFLYCSEPWVPS